MLYWFFPFLRKGLGLDSGFEQSPAREFADLPAGASAALVGIDASVPATLANLDRLSVSGYAEKVDSLQLVHGSVRNPPGVRRLLHSRMTPHQWG